MKHPLIQFLWLFLLGVILAVVGFVVADRYVNPTGTPIVQRHPVLPDSDLLLPWPQRDMLERPGR